MPSSKSKSGFQMYHRPLRPFEKAYTFWYIESLKPVSLQDPNVLQEK